MYFFCCPFQRKLISKLPRHTQMSVLTRFTVLHIDRLLKAVEKTLRESSHPESPASTRRLPEPAAQHYNRLMQPWAARLKELSVTALQLDIDKLLLHSVPLARVDASHPFNRSLGGPPEDVATDLDKAADWYSKASDILTKRSEYLESDEANITAIWAKGNAASKDRLRRVLGVEPPKYLEHGPLHPDPAKDAHNPKPSAKHLFVLA